MTSSRWSSLARSIAVGMAVTCLGAATIGVQPAAAGSRPSEDATRAWDAAVTGYGAVGTYFDDASGELVALMPSTTLAGQASALVMSKTTSLGIRARIVDATIDKATVEEIQSRLAALRPQVAAAYKYVSYFDASQQKVVLVTDAPTEVFADVLDRFAGHITLRQTPVQQFFSRIDDTAPHWGGAALKGPKAANPAVSVYCTSGFTVLYRGAAYMLTAAHCFAQGSQYRITNKKCTNSSCSTEVGGGSYMGYASVRAVDIDTELVTGSSYNGHIYTSESSGGAAIISAADPALGFTDYCTSGVYSKTNCGHQALSTAQACYLNNPAPCVTVYVFKYGVLPVQGDSGGPVYVRAGTSTAQARAMIVGGAGEVFWAVGWNSMASYFGLTIATA